MPLPKIPKPFEKVLKLSYELDYIHCDYILPLRAPLHVGAVHEPFELKLDPWTTVSKVLYIREYQLEEVSPMTFLDQVIKDGYYKIHLELVVEPE
jgi:hypothetical protein